MNSLIWLASAGVVYFAGAFGVYSLRKTRYKSFFPDETSLFLSILFWPLLLPLVASWFLIRGVTLLVKRIRASEEKEDLLVRENLAALEAKYFSKGEVEISPPPRRPSAFGSGYGPGGGY